MLFFRHLIGSWYFHYRRWLLCVDYEEFLLFLRWLRLFFGGRKYILTIESIRLHWIWFVFWKISFVYIIWRFWSPHFGCSFKVWQLLSIYRLFILNSFIESRIITNDHMLFQLSIHHFLLPSIWLFVCSNIWFFSSYWCIASIFRGNRINIFNSFG